MLIKMETIVSAHKNKIPAFGSLTARDRAVVATRSSHGVAGHVFSTI
jgi:hypothetical protein